MGQDLLLQSSSLLGMKSNFIKNKRQLKMNKKYYLWMIASIVLSLFASCSSDDNLGDEKTTVNVVRDLTFSVTFADYNEDVTTGNEKTRAVTNNSDTISRDFVNMNNGIVADVFFQRDN